MRRGPAHIAIAHSLGCDPRVLFAALDRTFSDRACGALGPPAHVLRTLAAEQGVYPDRDALARAVADRVDAVRADITLRRAAIPMLRLLRRRGLRTAVVSDCWYELPAFLPTMPIAALFDTHVYSFDIGRCKPHPAMYRAACRRLGVDPTSCLYVGDGGGRELSGARALGMTAVQLAAADLGRHLSYDSERDWDGLVVRTLPELVPLLARPLPPQPRPARTANPRHAGRPFGDRHALPDRPLAENVAF